MKKNFKIILSLVIGLSITSVSLEWVNINKISSKIKEEVIKLVNKNEESLRSVSNAPAPKVHQFEYKFNGEKFSYTVENIESQELAFKKASKECFQYYTKGVYPGEEKGLDIIDSCANPTKGFK